MNLERGKYRAKLATSRFDIERAQCLRHVAFALKDPSGIDSDSFDERCQHVLIEDIASNTLVCCFRILHLNNGRDIDQSYSAQFYELDALRNYEGKMLELGRFCISPKANDPDILRVAWAALTRYVDEAGIDLLFGCSSFVGTDENQYLDSFAVLTEKHLGPKEWLPRIKAPKVFQFASRLKGKPDMKEAMRRMPPLLKTYLMMGGWVSDHAVVDPAMNTLHVFTGVEIGLIPPARKRLLRALT